jgi:hypothetical protein
MKKITLRKALKNQLTVAATICPRCGNRVIKKWVEIFPG